MHNINLQSFTVSNYYKNKRKVLPTNNGKENMIATNTIISSSGSNPSKAVLVITAVPFHTDNNIDKVVIAMADFR